MNLPIEQVTVTKQAIQALWGDKLTVYRSKEVDNVITDGLIYSDKPCHLSQGKQPIQKQSETVATATSVFDLYVDTGVIIEQGDTLVIKHRQQEFKGVAGQSFQRNMSNVIPLEFIKIS